MPSQIQLPDGRNMIHATFEEVCQEVDAAFNIPAHQQIDASAPGRNIRYRARVEHETRLTQEHEAVMPNDALRPSAPNEPETEHPEVG